MCEDATEQATPLVAQERQNIPRRPRNHSTRSRRYCGTWNSHTSGDFRTAVSGLRQVRYWIAGNERAPTTGQEHVQFYICFLQQTAFTTLHAALPGAHLEVARGTSNENIEYCSKEGNFEEEGQRPLDANDAARLGGMVGGQLERQRWVDAKQAAIEGRWDDIPPDILIRNYNHLHCLRRDNMPRPEDLPDVCGFWIYGPPGYGKSHAARMLFPDFYTKDCSKWWQLYNGEPVALIDDWELSHKVLGHHLKIWGDKYGYIAEIKNHGIYARPRAIIITSNYSIHDVFGDDPQMEAAIRRRYIPILMDEFRMDITQFVRERVETPRQCDYKPLPAANRLFQ